MSSFRLICSAALTAAVAAFIADPAAAQNASTAGSSKPYLAGLRPPHERPKVAHAKTGRVVAQRQAATKAAQPVATKTAQPVATKTTQPATKRSKVTAIAKPHRPARLAEKINVRVAWPSVEPPATDEPTTPPTVLQFATDDAEPGPVAAPRPATPAPVAAAARPSPPAKIAASEERNTIDSAAAEPPATASTIVQTERFEAPASSQMRVILPAQSEPPVTASTTKDEPPARGSSLTVQMLVMLAGAISACIVAWSMIGFGSVRTFKTSVD